MAYRFCAARAIVATALFFSAGALAGEAPPGCKPLTRIASVDLVSAKDKSSVYVPVQVQGAPKLMLLDTGGVYTELTEATANELGLERHRGNFELYDVAGVSTSEFATASFALGRLKADKVAFVISRYPTWNDTRVAGLLAADILQHYDVSVDFGTNKLDLLSQDHCEGNVIYWKASAIAVVPMRVLDSGHIVVTVTLDGHPIAATLDTGASTSTLRQLAAEGQFGVTLGAADTPLAGELPDRAGAQIYRHRFKSLELDGIAVSNPEFILLPDLVSHKVANDPETGSRLADKKGDETSQDILLGMNVLRHLHLYIAYKEQKLYITPAGEPPADTHDAASR